MWATRYIRFHGVKHPGLMGAREVSEFRNWLAPHVTSHLAVVTAMFERDALAAKANV